MKLDLNDPRLTTYALGELADEARAELEDLLAGDPAARREIERLRAAAAELTRQLDAEPCPRLQPDQRVAIHAKFLPAETPSLFSWPRLLWTTGIATASVLLLAAVLLPNLSRARERARRSGPLSVAKSDPAQLPDPFAAYRDVEYKPYGVVNGAPLPPPSFTVPFVSPPTDHGVAEVIGVTSAGVGARTDGWKSGLSAPSFAAGRVDWQQAPSWQEPPSSRYYPGGENYAAIRESPFTVVTERPLSTFGLDVDTAAYANIRRFLKEGQLPPHDAVRIEEMLNYFRYDYPVPRREEPFALYAEMGECPWNSAHQLALIGLRAKDVRPRQQPDMNLVFLIDKSGSMQPENKLPLIKQALRLLVKQLTARDRVAIVVYADSSRVLLPSTPGDDHATILAAIEELTASGSTNGGAGIQAAYAQATRHFIEKGVNRVLLCTDGDFNVGTTGDSELTRLIKQQAETGVFLSVFGFGMGNLKDATLERLADKGNGQYAYIDDIAEARKALVDDLRSTLITVAKDVKLQVEFNPARVHSYRLIGYENRVLAARDFHDDRKDAGDLGAGHTVTALYEIIPAVGDGGGAPLKYQPPRQFGDEWLSLKLRYKEPDADKSQLLTAAIKDTHLAWRNASEDFRFAAAVAAFGMVLRQSPHRGDADFDLVLRLADSARRRDPNGYRREFVELVGRACQLTRVDR